MKKIKKAAVLISSLVILTAGAYSFGRYSSLQSGGTFIVSADDCVSDGLIYVKNDDGTVTVKGHTADADLVNVVIPDEIEGCPVAEIGARAFQYCQTMQTIKLGRYVKSIGDEAFESSGAYADIKISEITIPDELNVIGRDAFNNLDILKLGIPENCTRISSVFLNSSLLSEINVDSSNQKYSSDSGILYSKDKSTLLKCPESIKLTSYAVSDRTTRINDYAFYACKELKKLDLGRNTTEIGNYSLASYGSASDKYYEELTLPDDLKIIGDSVSEHTRFNIINVGEAAASVPYVFYSNSFLTAINVESGNKNYSSDKGVLYSADKTTLIRCPENTPLTEYSVCDGTVTVSAGAFNSCFSLKKLDLGRNTKVIGDNALSGYSMKSMDFSELTVPDSIEKMSDSTLKFTNIRKLRICASVQSVPSQFYFNGLLTEINVDDGCRNFSSDKGILYNGDKTTLIRCPEQISLSSYTVSDSTKKIAASAFYDCRKITSLDLGRNTTEIGDKALSGLSNNYSMKFNELVVPDHIDTMGSNVFENAYVYKITAPQTVESINSEFYSNYSLNEIYVHPDNKSLLSDKGILYTKDRSVLIKCPASSPLLTYDIFEQTESIKDYAFSYTGMQSIYIPKTVGIIGDNSFYGSKLTTVRGVKDSYAQTYAEDKKYQFEAVEDPGQAVYNYDINGDGSINIMDIMKLKQYVLSGR